MRKGGIEADRFELKESIFVEIDYEVLDESSPTQLHVHLKDLAGHYLFVAMSNDNGLVAASSRSGRFLARCVIPSPLLNVGDFRLDLEIWPGAPVDPKHMFQVLLSFTIYDDNTAEGVRGTWPNQWPNCLFRPAVPWEITRLAPAANAPDH